MFLIKKCVALDVSAIVVKAIILVRVWSLGVALYFETLRMSENLLDPPLTVSNWVFTLFELLLNLGRLYNAIFSFVKE